MADKEGKHTKAFRAGKMRPGEEVVASLDGYIGEMMGKGTESQHNGTFILTTTRVAFYRKGMFGEVFEAIPIDKITSLETRSLLGYRALTLHTSHDSLAFKTFAAAKDFQTLHDSIEQHRTAAQEPPSDAQAAGADPIEQIGQLADLRDAGVLTAQEYEAKKAELLARI